MNFVSDTLTGLRLGKPKQFQSLTLFPLLGGPARERTYSSLTEAVRQKTAAVSEISHGGNVPELLLRNTGEKPVLILDGEELRGGKQNRTANTTILCPAGASLRIPVTCVEAGRWRYSSKRQDCGTSDHFHFKEGRMNKMASVARSLKFNGTRTADQREVWNDIADKCASVDVYSSTSAMADMYESHRAHIDDYVNALSPEPGQLGAVFMIGTDVEGLELFDSEDTLSETLPKLVRSYAIDAMERPGPTMRSAWAESVKAFIDKLASITIETYPGLGLGTEFRLTAPGVVAGGLAADERIVHLLAFAGGGEPGGQKAPSDGIAAQRALRRWTRR